MDYYGDNDPSACQWIRELIRQELLPHGEVDEQDIKETDGRYLRQFRRVHLFAGIGGWAYALELAGWPANRPVWTGSCPCQPFSVAGKKKGQADERHLWPVFLGLIRKCHPPTIFGEQVASDDGYRWLARVRDDLEEAGYAVGCADLPACCAGSPIVRQRLWFVASSRLIAPRNFPRSAEELGTCDGASERRSETLSKPGRRGQSRDLASANSQSCGQRSPIGNGSDQGSGKTPRPRSGGAGGACDLGCPQGEHREIPIQSGRQEQEGHEFGRPSGISDLECSDRQRRQAGAGAGAGGISESFWASYEVVPCLDGKSRRVEPGTFPLATGIPARMGRLRGYGNSIVPQVAAKFIRAFLETEG